MFHVISGWLARHVRRIRDYRLAADQAFALAHGWQAEQVGKDAWIYRDPRFVQLLADDHVQLVAGDGKSLNLGNQIASR
jgi:hypothetical protein